VRPLPHAYGDAERTIAEALAAELGAEQALAARLAAAALVAALRVAEETAAARMQEADRALTEPEVAALLDGAVVFARAGIGALTATGPATTAGPAAENA
jgi:hypothetical protein